MMPLQESSRLIKARSARQLGAHLNFNYDDLRLQCDEYVAAARHEGHRLIEEATVQAEQIRRLAFEDGRASGQEAGLNAAHELIDARATEIAARRLQEQLHSVRPAFETAVRALDAERDRWIAAWETAAVKLATAIAGKIIHRELAREPRLAVESIRQALQMASGMPQLSLRLHPDDLAQLRECGTDILTRLSTLGDAAFVPDERISRGGCVIETRHGVIDAQLESQLARINSELLQD